MLTRRSWLVYGVLLAIWLLLIGWQTGEHLRVRRSARAALTHRAKDISGTLVLIMKSQRLFSSTERIESILNDLVKQDEIQSICLVNATNGILASAGPKIEIPPGGLGEKEYWDEKEKTLTLVNPVDLGRTNIIIPRSEFPTNRPPPPRDDRGEPIPPPPRDDRGEPLPLPPQVTEASNNAGTATTNLARASTDPGPPPDNFGTNGRPRRPRPSPEEIKALKESRGTHGFIMVMSAGPLDEIVRRDLWLRGFISLLATISVLGYGLAWSNVSKTSELQIRLVRASELNTHLRDLNLAAAGLAHETRNPLNIVRGLAQMISKQDDASPEIRIKSKEIIHETDRVASQLNEFINYSRPREVRRVATRLNSTVSEVIRALNYDIEEKKVRVENQCEDLTVEADEQLLRQALFNLVLNAIQAVKPGGEIIIRAGRRAEAGSEAFVQICDNGPGVAPEHRTEIFKPYFTMHEEGTGLGLAVVQQIVLAHGWEIQCLPNQPTGACFRITHLKPLSRN